MIVNVCLFIILFINVLIIFIPSLCVWYTSYWNVLQSSLVYVGINTLFYLPEEVFRFP